MKKLSILYAIMAVMLLSAFTVSAAVIPVDTFDRTNPTFGSATQEASNPRHEDVAKRIVITSPVSVNFKNDAVAEVTVTSIRVIPNTGFTETDLQIQLVASQNLTIPGSNIPKSIQFTARIPEKLNAIDAEDTPAAISVATVELLDVNNTVVGSFPVYMQRENNLEIRKLEATINDNQRKSLSNDDNLDKLTPGDRISLEAKASNRYDKRAKQDMTDITLEISCENEDNFDFDDKSQDMGDLSPDDEDTESLVFDIEPDAENDNTRCIVSVLGKDESGARHGEIINFDIDVTRKSHDIQITAAIINPTSVSCTDREMQLTVDLLNLGRSDEDRVALEVTSKAISYQDRVSNIQMDQDDSAQQIFIIPVDATKLKSGVFAIQVQSFYDNTKSTDTETVQVDNLCNAVVTGNGNTGVPKTPVVQGALELESENIKVAMGSSTSIPVKVTNMEEDTPVEYMVALADTAEFADGTSSKSVFLNPGQQSTVLLNLKAKAKIDAGKYSGIIVLKDSTGKTLETKTFTVDVVAKQSTGLDLGSWFSGSDSRVFWIIGDIILIIVAIFFIRLIFTGGKKKQTTNKKLADYEAEMSKKKPARRRK